MDAPRTLPETLAFAAWVNCPPNAVPPEYRQHTCEATMTAWRRVVAALHSPEALATSPEAAKLVADAEARGMERAADILLECSVWCDSQPRTDDGWRNGVTDARKHGMARIRAEAAAIRRAAEETGT